MSRVLRQNVEEFVMFDVHAPRPPHFGPEEWVEHAPPLACRRIRRARDVERAVAQMLLDSRVGGLR